MLKFIQRQSNKIKQIILIVPGFRNLWKKLKNFKKQIVYEEKFLPKNIPPLYFKPHDYHWFQDNLPDDWVVDIRCWVSIDKIFSSTFVPDNFLGHILLEIIFLLETIFSHAFATIGRFPMIIIRKQKIVHR